MAFLLVNINMKFTFVTEIKSENLMDDDPADRLNVILV
jgi:hypothetical protein